MLQFIESETLFHHDFDPKRHDAVHSWIKYKNQSKALVSVYSIKSDLRRSWKKIKQNVQTSKCYKVFSSANCFEREIVRWIIFVLVCEQYYIEFVPTFF